MEYELYPNASSPFFKKLSTKSDIDSPIADCGLYLKTFVSITKGKEGLDGVCRRFFGIHCKNLQDAIIRSVDPQVSCINDVKEVVRDWSQDQGIEVDLNNLEIYFDHFWWTSQGKQ